MQCKRITHMMRLGFPQSAIVTLCGPKLNSLAGILYLSKGAANDSPPKYTMSFARVLIDDVIVRRCE